MSRIYFNTTPTPGEWLNAMFAPRSVRRAIAIAQSLDFSTSIRSEIRATVVRRLRKDATHYGEILQDFQSSEALAVLAFMDTFREIITEKRREIRRTQRSDPAGAATIKRQIGFYDKKLTECALYMRRSGHMDENALGASLYRAAAALETIYPETEPPTLKDWRLSTEPVRSMGKS